MTVSGHWLPACIFTDDIPHVGEIVLCCAALGARAVATIAWPARVTMNQSHMLQNINDAAAYSQCGSSTACGLLRQCRCHSLINRFTQKCLSLPISNTQGVRKFRKGSRDQAPFAYVQVLFKNRFIGLITGPPTALHVV